MSRSRVSIAVLAILLIASPGRHSTSTFAQSSAAQSPAPAPAAGSQDARTWIGRNAEMEAYLKTAEMLSFDELSTGVTKPLRAHLPEGGPMKYLVLKQIQPGRYGGYYESYKSEIAAYELDKLLKLDMVPPTVERVYKGVRGAAVMWASNTKNFKELGGAPEAPPVQHVMWTRQLVKAKMFQNLVADIDPNLGNWLVDPGWNLVLIDFSRAFTIEPRLQYDKDFTRVDPDLWKRMQDLSEATLLPAIGKWVGSGERKALLNRRDKMQKKVDELVKERGETYVFMGDMK